MYRKILLAAFLLLAAIILINYLIIKPRAEDFVHGQLSQKFSGYIAYKNNQKGFYLYLADDLPAAKRLKLDTLYETEAFNKPRLGGDIKHIIFATPQLYEAAHIADKIEKLPNSNKCFLISKDSIYKFNCYVIQEDKRKSFGNVDEWKLGETGFGKKYRIIDQGNSGTALVNTDKRR